MISRRSFFRQLVGTAIAVSAAGRMALQPELKSVGDLEGVISRLNTAVMKVWHDRMRDAYLQEANKCPTDPL